MKATVLALALLCAGAVFAQAPPATATHAAQHLDNLAVLLDLTDAQKTQVQAILEAEHAKMKASFEEARASGTKPDVEQMRAQHQQLHQELLQKLTPVLSPVQLKKFQVLMQMHAEMHGGHGHFAHDGPAGATPPSQN
jgi:Spy/CpxP family protein refolding chaperone